MRRVEIAMVVFEHPHNLAYTFSLAERMIFSPSFIERIVQELQEVGVGISTDNVFMLVLQMYKMHHKIRISSSNKNYEFLHALGDVLHLFQLKELEQIRAGIDPYDSIVDLIGWKILDVVRIVLSFDRKVNDQLFWQMAECQL